MEYTHGLQILMNNYKIIHNDIDEMEKRILNLPRDGPTNRYIKLLRKRESLTVTVIYLGSF